MTLTRRDFIKANAIAATAVAAGVSVPLSATNLITQSSKSTIKWDKAPCRFCGTGCSVLVGTQHGKVVSTQGDPEAEVNKGLNCIKGYFLSKIMYGKDRLTQPLLRMTDGEYDKEGDFTPVSCDKAFDFIACLLYTYDAYDDQLRVDLVGSRFSQKNTIDNQQNTQQTKTPQPAT